MEKKKKPYGKLVLGCGLLVLGLVLVAANLPLAIENRVDIMEGIVLILLGGYLLGSLIWSS